MDQSVRVFLIKTQQKIIGHYRQVLQGQGVPEPEREGIRSKLTQAEAELERFFETIMANT